MPKRKKLPKIPNYEGLPQNIFKLTVQKSNPLIAISDIMPLTELKILDAYLSRIDSHKPDKRLVHFEKGELEKILGVDRIRVEDLLTRIKELNKNPVLVPNDTKPNGFDSIWLFEKASCIPDENGIWQVDLVCTPSAMEYIFNIEGLGYIRYRLKNVINLTSKYSYVLFLYLIDNRYRKTWRLNLTDLKTLLNCDAERYKQFKFFNSEILKKCHKELCDKTDISFEYKPVKHGRVVTAIQFSVHTLNDKLEEQLRSDSLEKPHDIDYDSDLSVLLDKVFKGEFPSDNIQELHDLVCKAVPENDNKARVQYFLERYRKMESYSPNKKGRLNYIKTIIENEIQSKGDSSSYDLNEYEKFARSYDFSDMPWNVKPETEKS